MAQDTRSSNVCVRTGDSLFGDRIRIHRLSKGMTLEAYGRALGYSAHKIQNIERGQQRADHVFLANLRSVFGVDLNELIAVVPNSGVLFTDRKAKTGADR